MFVNSGVGTIQGSGKKNTQQRRVAWSAENKVERLPNLSKSMIDFTTQMLCLIFIAIFQYLNFEKNTKRIWIGDENDVLEKEIDRKT